MYNRELGVNVSILRYFNVYGPRQTVAEEMGVVPIFVKRALLGESLRIFGDGEQTRDFLHVRDVVQANLRAFVSNGGTGRPINVGGGGKEISIRLLSEKVIDLCKSDSKVEYLTQKPGDIRRLVADISLARELIGFTPSVELEEGLRGYIESIGINDDGLSSTPHRASR
jgi:UDP-glucose 4-epimerase